MRIAVATDDGISIAGHFGRCSGFIIFETGDNGVTKIEQRANANSHHHEQGDCGHHSQENAGHNHDSFVTILHDCKVIICRGMGRKAVVHLAASGITPAIITEDITVLEAAELYSRGKLNASNDSTCCSH
jgi:predicted Fe-Mo cluster-binding NifX family protein